MKCDILITYSWNRVGYNILRDLTDHGLKVAVCDTSKYNISSLSNRKTCSFVYADPFSQTDQFFCDLNHIIEQCQPKVLIPTHEETLILAKYVDRIPDNVIVPIMDFKTLLHAHNKISSSQYAKEAGVPVPAMYTPKNVDDLKAINDQLEYPVVLKIPKSNAAKGVFYAHDFDELKKLFQENFIQESNPQDELYLQDFVTGEGYGASYLYNRGEMVTGFVHRRLMEKTHTGGVSTNRVSVKNEKLLNYGRAILDKYQWHGVAMVEFKYDSIKDEAWFIEINPRYWGSLPLPIASGLSIPYWHYCIATQTPFEVNDYREGVVSKWILGEFITLVERIIKRKLTWEEFKSIFNFKADNYDDFKKDDPKAFLGELLYYFLKLVKSGKLNPQSNQTKEF